MAKMVATLRRVFIHLIIFLCLIFDRQTKTVHAFFVPPSSSLSLTHGGSELGGFVAASKASSSQHGLGSTTAARHTKQQQDNSNRTGGNLAMKIVLYGCYGTRSPLVNWYLHELKLDFDTVETFEDEEAEESVPNPFKMIPCLKDGDTEIFESGAILMYLADKYGGLRDKGPEERVEVLKWIMWANVSLERILFKTSPDMKVYDTGLRERPVLIDILDDHLKGCEWLVNDKFSAADVAVGAYLLFVPLFFEKVEIYQRFQGLGAYMGRCIRRKAYQKAFGKEATEYLKDRFLVSRWKSDFGPPP